MSYDNWKLDYPSHYDDEPATRYCECGEEIYDEATDCDDCMEFICEECGEYNENIVKVAPHENYCPDCFEDFEPEDFE